MQDKSKWPYAHDVEYFDDLPNRQPSLLFAGLAYREPKYIALWRTLPPDPKTPEIIRNFPDTAAGALGGAGVGQISAKLAMKSGAFWVVWGRFTARLVHKIRLKIANKFD